MKRKLHKSLTRILKKDILALGIAFILIFGFSKDINAQYCSASGSNEYIRIGMVTSGNTLSGEDIDHPLTPYFNTSGYFDYTNMVVSRAAGESINFNITGEGQITVKVFIDWNQDEDFADDGYVIDYLCSGNQTMTVQVPEDAPLGQTRIRLLAITCIGDGASAPSNPCAQGFNGQAIDYTLEVLPPPVTYISMDLGAETWCPEETREVEVTIENSGSEDWINGKIGAKWLGDADFTFVSANDLEVGETDTYTFTMTAPSTLGTTNIVFNVQDEDENWIGADEFSAQITISEPDASFSYASTNYCSDDNAITPTLAEGATAGVFTSTTGLVIDPITGEIDISASDIGSYIITNTIDATTECPEAIYTFEINIYDLPTIDAGLGQEICEGEEVTLTATASNGIITWDNGVVDGEAFIPTETTTYTATADINGCTSTDEVTVIVKETPAINAGQDTDICEGEEITLTATVSSGTVTWDNGVTDGEAFTPTETTIYTASVEVDGCTGTDQVTITVNDMPTIEANEDMEICEGEEVTLSATASNGTITWDNGVVDGEAFIPTETTTYTATADNNGCTSTDEVTVIVKETPAINAGQDTDICEGEEITLTATVSSGTVTWDNGVTDGEAFTPTETTIYTASVEVDGCTNTDQVTITVNEMPTIEANEDMVICEGEEITLTATASNGTITWDNGVINGEAFTPTETTTYTATADNNGCTETTVVVVTVNPVPTVDAGQDMEICEGEEITLSATTSSESITWDNGVTDGEAFTPTETTTYTVTVGEDDCTATDQITVTIVSAPTVDAGQDMEICEGEEITLSATTSSESITWDNGVIDGEAFTPTETTTYTVTVGEGDCTATDQITVTIVSAPTVDAGQDMEICEGEEVTLTATTSSESITWDNGVIDGEAFTPTETTTYTVTVGEGDCTSTDQIIISVNAIPEVSIDGVTEACVEDADIQLTGTPEGGVFDGVGMNNNSFSPSEAGAGTHTITYTYESEEGCSATATIEIEVEICLDISENELTNISVVPNPASNLIEVKLNGNNKIDNIQLVSFEGKVIQINSTIVDSQTIKLNVSSVATGIYFIQIVSNNQSLTHKLVIR